MSSTVRSRSGLKLWSGQFSSPQEAIESQRECGPQQAFVKAVEVVVGLKLRFEFAQNGNGDGLTLAGFRRLGTRTLDAITCILKQQSIL